MTNFEVLALKIDQVVEKTDETKKDIDKLIDSSTDIKERILLMESWSSDHEERDKSIQKHISKLASTVEPLAVDYKIRKLRKKWTDKIVWLVLSFVIGGSLFAIKDVFLS